MYYNTILTPTVIRTGKNILGQLDQILESAHLYFPRKILITQENLFDIYREKLVPEQYDEVIFCKGGDLNEAREMLSRIPNTSAVLIAFGGGSVLDLVKYVGTQLDKPYITMPSALSNDAIYSCVARLTYNHKKKSSTVQPPMGVIVDLNIIKMCPRELLISGAGDLVTNLSAIKDWELAHEKTGEPINELSCMLGRQSALSIWDYSANDIYSDDFLRDLAHGLITSGLSMTVAGHTRASSGSEHLISHAIDEFFPEKSTIHGIQVAWAFLEIEKQLRKDEAFAARLQEFYDRIGLTAVISDKIPWAPEDLKKLIPYGLKIRKRYTILSEISE